MMDIEQKKIENNKIKKDSDEYENQLNQQTNEIDRIYLCVDEGLPVY